MYKSPIEMALETFRFEQENNILKAVQNVGINVNKDELIKALQYDRDQYNKGYKDGAKELADQLKRALRVFDIELHIIDTILKDMGVNV
jgi:hypothetical protein